MLPKILSIGKIVIYSYPLFMGIAWGVAYNLSYKLFAKNQISLRFNELFWGIFLSSWLGAKILFLFTGYGSVQSASFWLGGGFVFYGGLIGALLFIVVYTKILKRVELSALHLVLPAVAYSHAIGRIGCFLAGCCYGVETSCSVGVAFKGVVRHPVQLYEVLGLMILGTILLKAIKYRAQISISVYMLGYSLLRFVLEFFRDDEIRGIYGSLSTSQIVSLVIMVVGIVYWVRVYGKNLYKARR